MEFIAKNQYIFSQRKLNLEAAYIKLRKAIGLKE